MEVRTKKHTTTPKRNGLQVQVLGGRFETRTSQMLDEHSTPEHSPSLSVV